MQINRVLLLLVLLFIPVFPKINLVEIPGLSFAVRIDDLFIAFIVFITVLIVFRENKSLKVDRFSRYLFLYVAVSFVSLLAAICLGTVDNQTASVLFFLRRIEYLSIFFVAYFIADNKSIRIIKNTVVPAFLAVAGVAILQMFNIAGGFFHGEYTSGVNGRIFSTFSTAGELAAYIAIIFTFSVLAILDEKPFKKAVWLVIAALQKLILFISVTRLELISIPIGLAVLGIMKGKIRQTLVLVIILAVLAGLMMPESVKEKFSSIFSRETVETVSYVATGRGSVDINNALETEKIVSPEYDLSALMRIYYWINAIDVFKTYPVFGAGPSALGDVVDNNYLRILGENGIVGFAVFIMLIYQIWKNCVKVYNNKMMSKEMREYSLFVLVMLVNMLVIALMADVFEMSKIAFLFWLLVGVFFKAKYLSEKEYAA